MQDNLAKLDEIVREAKKYDAQLISFPELYLEGYTLTPELVQQLAEPVDGPSISRVVAMARTYHISIICPYAERDGSVSIKLIDFMNPLKFTGYIGGDQLN